VIAKKLVKSALGREPILQLAHLLPSVMERMPATDALLRRVYRKVLGLHINRGIRTALRNGVGEGRPITTRPIPRQAPGLVEGVADSGA
jgi:hypothetical protein